MRRMWTTLGLAAAVAANTLAAGAQEVKVRRPAPQESVEELIITQSGEPAGRVEVRGDTLMFLSTEMTVGGKVVKGAPYSAQAVTETVQTLADGNRIVRRHSASVYRDAEGRTRRDQSLAHLLPFGPAGEAEQTSFINDPVAGVNYVLEPRAKTARKLPVIEFHLRTPAGQGAASDEKTHQRKIEVERQAASGFAFSTGTPGDGAAGAPEVTVFKHSSSKAETKSEKLERRTVEGVEAEGHRTVTTIPAGEIGNEQPIQIVHERWYSPELQLVVMTRHSDPRFGETTYRLTNINRSAPDPALFQVPPDYAIKEDPHSRRGLMRRKRSALDGLTEN